MTPTIVYQHKFWDDQESNTYTSSHKPIRAGVNFINKNKIMNINRTINILHRMYLCLGKENYTFLKYYIKLVSSKNF